MTPGRCASGSWRRGAARRSCAAGCSRVQTLHSCARLLSSIVVKHEGTTGNRDALDVAAFMIVAGLLEPVLGWIYGPLTVHRAALIPQFGRFETTILRSTSQSSTSAA